MDQNDTKEISDFISKKIEKLKQMSYSELKKEREDFLKSHNESYVHSEIRKMMPENNFDIISAELKRYQYAIDAELIEKAKKKD